MTLPLCLYALGFGVTLIVVKRRYDAGGETGVDAMARGWLLAIFAAVLWPTLVWQICLGALWKALNSKEKLW